MSEQHQKFLKRLAGSISAIFKVAQYLHSKGYDIHIPPIKYAPTAAEHLDYVDDGDIKIRKDGGEWERIEVKGIKHQFTCREDYPFPEFMVNSKKPVDRANPFPKAYFIVAKDLEHCAIVMGSTRSQWYEVTRNPTNTGVEETFYATSLDVPKFIKF
jgi:hypothetical protein